MRRRPIAEHLGRDLHVSPFYAGHTWLSVDLLVADGDLRATAGVHNLRQALLLRLLTERGELAPLGHASYGSRLHELIGEEMTDAARRRARMFVLEAVCAEKRVERVESLEVLPPEPSTPHTLRMHLVVRAVGVAAPVSFAVEVAP